jgi:hypothetical protein
VKGCRAQCTSRVRLRGGGRGAAGHRSRSYSTARPSARSTLEGLTMRSLDRSASRAYARSAAWGWHRESNSELVWPANPARRWGGRCRVLPRSHRLARLGA